MNLKVLYINDSDGLTGWIGGYRTFKGISEYCQGIDIEMLVREKSTFDKLSK